MGEGLGARCRKAHIHRMMPERSQPRPSAEPAEERPAATESVFDPSAILQHMPASMRGQSAVLVAILVLLIAYTLYFAAPVVIPLVLAVLLNLLLSPLVRRLRRLRIPEPAGAALVLVGFLALVGWTGYILSGPATGWIEKGPQNLALVTEKLRAIHQPVQEASKQVEQIAKGVGQDEQANVVKVQDQSWSEYFVVGTTELLTQTFIVVVLLYFLLASGDLFMRRFVRALSSGQEKRQAVEIVRAVQTDVSTYLGTVAMINAGLGAATGLAMWAIGLPNPLLWGVLAGLLNFVPYAGAMVTILVLGFVGLLSFDEIGYALLAPGLFFVLTNIEANLVTPALIGARLTLNPALVFVALVVWTWLWGIAGAVLAVPLLVTFKAFADHLQSWNGISIFLGRRD